MAEGQSMTAADVVAKVLGGEHADFLREAVALVARELMEAEIAAEIGAGRGEVSAERDDAPQRLPRRGRGRRGSARSSWRSRASARARRTSRASWSRAGAREQAMVGGGAWRPTSTASRPARSTGWSSSSGIQGMSKDRVSRALPRRWTSRSSAFRERPLEGAYPYLWLDAKQLKVRDRGARALQGAGDRLRRARDRAGAR